MRYKKKTDDFNSIISQWWVLIHSLTWTPYTPNQLMWRIENDKIINKKWFNKLFRGYSKDMRYDVKDFWYCITRTLYWLDQNNQLSWEYLDILKQEMSTRWVTVLLQRLIKSNMIARTWRGKYTLNPNIAQYWTALDKSIYKLFEW